MINPGMAPMLVKAKQDGLLREVGRRPVLDGQVEGLRGGPALQRGSPIGRWLFLVLTRELVHLGERLGWGRDELVRVIDGLS